MESAPNALQDFPSEEAETVTPPASAAVVSRASTGIRPTVIGVVVASAAVVCLVAATPLWIRPSPPVVPTGKLTIHSTPAGVETLVDGAVAGTTPLALSIGAGPHTIVLRRGLEERQLPITINPGSEVTHHIDFPAKAEATTGGMVTVTSEPPGAQVTLDGKPRGVSPLILADVAPGEHIVSVSGEMGTAQRRVIVETGSNASVVFSLSKAAGPSAGWLSVSAPFGVQVFDGNDLVGTDGISRIMVTAGRHDIRLVNTALGFQESRKVEVTAGKLAVLRVEPPTATVSANARPWADVLVDGAPVGQTPIANLSLTIGPHQVVFRHPQLGEQRQAFVVTTKGPNRVSADLTKK